jgi:hypothetical protein
MGPGPEASAQVLFSFSHATQKPTSASQCGVASPMHALSFPSNRHSVTQ